MTVVLVAVDVPSVGDERHKQWAKVVSNVDTGKSSGWAFEGEFVATGGVQDLPVGGVLLVYGEKGSRANPQQQARVFTVNGDGTLSFVSEAKGSAWARTLRDSILELLDQEIPATGLAAIPDFELVAELERRGYQISSS